MSLHPHPTHTSLARMSACPVWGSSSTSGLPRLVFQYIRSTSSSVPVPVYLPHIQFQSTSSSAPVPVYFVPGPAPCVGLFSSHPSTPSSNGGSPGLAHFGGLLSLQGLIFIACGISLLCKDSSSFTLLILMAVTSLKCIGFFFVFVCFYFN